MPSFMQIGQNPKEEFEKVGFAVFAILRKKNSRRKWAWPSPFDSAQFKESGDIRFLNVRHTVWEL